MKSTIRRINQVKQHTNTYGTTHYHQLEMENGAKISIGKKKELSVGEELEYEIEDTGQEYNKAKTPFAQPAQSSPPPTSTATASLLTSLGPSERSRGGGHDRHTIVEARGDGCQCGSRH